MQSIYKSRAFGYAEVEDAIWFSNIYFNGLEKINKETGKVEYIAKFPDGDIRCQWQHSSVVSVGQKLIFVPFRSEYIVTYDIKMNKFISIPLDLKKKSDLYFFGACVYKQYVYMFPAKAECIIRYDTQKNVIKCLDVLNVISDEIPKDSSCFVLQYVLLDEKVYFPFANLNAVAVFDLRNEKIEIFRLEIEGGCSTICYQGEVFYMSSSKMPKIYSWNKENGQLVVYDMFPKEFNKNNDCFSYLFAYSQVIGKKVFYFPMSGNMILSFDMISKQICAEHTIANLYNDSWNTYCTPLENNTILILLADEDDFFHSRDLNGTIQFKCVSQQNCSYNLMLISKYLIENHYFNVGLENKGMLNTYIELLQYSNCIVAPCELKRYGRKIYDKILNH